MDDTAVKAFETIVERSVHFEVDGKTFTKNKNGNVERVIYEPHPDAVEVHTLTGLVDFIRANIDSLDYKKYFIVVRSPDEVCLYSSITGESRKRDLIACVQIDDHMSTYQFGRYQEVEQFIISLNSLFEESPDRERVINFVSRIHGGGAFTLSDDGVTQMVEVSKRINGAVTEKESAPKIVVLKPFRTFRDIEQPESSFLLRLKLLHDDTTTGACLFEADGGRWRNTAIKTIQAFLEENLKEEGIVVIA